MWKVLQTVVDKGKGNCMQAAIASLFDLTLSETPNFIEFDGKEGTNAHYELIKFMRAKGYKYSIWNVHYTNGRGEFKLNPRSYEPDLISFTKKLLKVDGGVDGHWYASVRSRTFEYVSHAVIIDKDMNVVHDPNPNQKCLGLGADEIIDIVMVSGAWVIDVNQNIIIK